MFNSCKEFGISETVKNISRFVDGEDYNTDIEERFNIPWRMCIQKRNGYLNFFLQCEKETCDNRTWSIETEITIKLMSQNGKNKTKNFNYTFDKPVGSGQKKFIKWDELERDYAVDNCIVIEAYVKIVKMSESPCTVNKNYDSFILSKTVANISSIKEGGDYYTITEKRYNIPWRLKIQKKNGFFGLYLQCDKEISKTREWAIEVEQDLRLVSLNGQSLWFKGTTTFKSPIGYGHEKFIRWDDMLEKYMVNDSIIIEARVKIIKMTGCEEKTSIDDLEDEFSDCVINIGGKNYSVKRQ